MVNITEIICSDVSNQRGDVGVVWHDKEAEDVLVTLCILFSRRVLV